MALSTRQVSASEIARRIGVSRAVLYKWKDEIIGNSAYQTMRKHNEPSLEAERDALREEVARLNQEIRRRQMELDILKKAEEIIKKDPGISISHLNNREKTKIADALRQTYPLTELLHVLSLARSSYFYHRAALKAGDKYATIRTMLTDIFNSNYQCYGYRRLHAMLRHEGIRLSEKVVRRLMVEEQLVVSRNRRRRYSSYCGEIGPAPDNLIARDFKAEQPNQKWLTDITEFQLPAGKVWLSPVVDCFDGKVVSWSLSTRPDAELVNTMLDSAVETLNAGERPVIHSDKGSQYVSLAYTERLKEAKLLASTGSTGDSYDNAMAESINGLYKAEVIHRKSWKNRAEVELSTLTWVDWYNNRRLLERLGHIPPAEAEKAYYASIGNDDLAA
nr:IS3 family transposase [Shigella sonnei]